MRSGLVENAGLQEGLLEVALHAARRQPAGAVVEEKGRLGINAGALVEIGPQGRERLAANRHETLLAPLAEHPHQGLVEVDIGHIQGRQF